MTYQTVDHKDAVGMIYAVVQFARRVKPDDEMAVKPLLDTTKSVLLSPNTILVIVLRFYYTFVLKFKWEIT